MKIKEFIAACREFTEYAKETKSGTGWVFGSGVAGPTIIFRAGPGQHNKIYDPFHAILMGWNEVHNEQGWIRKPCERECAEDLGLSKKSYYLLMRAVYCIDGCNKKLRKDLMEACGLTEEDDKQCQGFIDRRRAENQKRRA